MKKKIFLATLTLIFSFVVLGSAYLVYNQITLYRSQANTNTVPCSEATFNIPLSSETTTPFPRNSR